MSSSVTITFSQKNMIKEFQTQLWKLGRSAEKQDNAKQIYNLQADNSAADLYIVEKSYSRRLTEAIQAVYEYVTSENSTTTSDDTITTVVLLMPGAWGSDRNILEDAMCSYINSGMNYDWLKHTYPAEAGKFKSIIEDNKESIKTCIYAIKAPVAQQTQQTPQDNE